ncbi:MAG: AAA family ATPase, partial [Solirubrobacteraceae bacterium]|nr:AAA family ATPase [Solirubrobacteraceae bacterium]
MPAGSATPDALERERELARIRSALGDAAGGRGRLLVIEGPPGIGKTRIVEEARAIAKSLGFARLKAVGEEPEQAIAWGVVRQLVERSILRYSGEVRDAILAGPAGRALTAIAEATDRSRQDDADLAGTMHALWWVAADLSADRPLLITVDDAQWSDPPSLRFLAYLARRLEDLSICLVIGTRPPGHDGASGPLAELTSGRYGERLALGPLSAAGVAQLLSGAHPEVAAAVHAASGGNPFYVEQLFAELGREGLEAGDATTASRVGQLGPETVGRGLLMHLSPAARALAAATAVLGTRSPVRVAVGLAALTDAASAAAADELRAAHVLTDDVLALAFIHPVVREAVLAGLRPGERATLHGAAARALRDEGASDERVAAQLAHAPAGSLPGAEHLLRGAAERALGQGDASTAAQLLRRVLDESPGDIEAEATLGFASIAAGEPQEGGRLLRSAAARVDDLDARARYLAGAAQATAATDGPEAAIEELRIAREGFGAQRTPATLLLDARLAMARSYLMDRSPGSAAHLQQFEDLEGSTVDERTLLALLVQRRFNEGRPADEVRALGERVMGRDPSVPTGIDLLPWTFVIFGLIYGGDLDEVEATLRGARSRIRKAGSPLDFVVLSAVSAQTALRIGDVVRAGADASAGLEALGLAEPGPAADAMRAVLTRQGMTAALERSDMAGAAALLEDHDRRGVSSTVPVERLRETRAALALARDDAHEALAQATALGDAETLAGTRDNPVVPWKSLASVAALRLGDAALAESLAEDQLDSARRWNRAPEVASALRLSARVGRAEARIPLLEEAAALIEGSPARLVLAGTLCDLGDALRVDGRRSDAREPLRRAADVAEACGAT